MLAGGGGASTCADDADAMGTVGSDVRFRDLGGCAPGGLGVWLVFAPAAAAARAREGFGLRALERPTAAGAVAGAAAITGDAERARGEGERVRRGALGGMWSRWRQPASPGGACR